MTPLPPGPRGYPLIGVVPQLIKHGADYLTQAFREYGDVVRLKLVGPISMCLIAHPEHIQHVLKHNHRNYIVKRPSMHLSAMMGNGLTLSNGELWRKQRRLMQPAFHRRTIDEIAAITKQKIGESVDGWRLREGAPLDVMREMERLSFSVLLATLFGSSLRQTEVDGITEAVELVLRAAGRGLFLEVPPFVPTPENLKIKRALRELKATVGRLIEAQRRSPEKTQNLLTLLLEARDEETGLGMSEQQLYDELISIFVAGYETTAVGMAWALYMLALHPAVQDKLARELQAVLAGRAATLEDLPRLPYLSQVVSESMRIYPPFWAMTREVVSEDVVGGYRIPAKALVVVSPHVTHRHPAFWPDAERFDPERFTEAQNASRHRLAYFPFGAGPRYCIGDRSGLLTTQLTLATVVQRYRLSPVPEHQVKLHAAMTIRPKNGILLHCSQRASTSRA